MKSINVQNLRLAELEIVKNASGERTFKFGDPELVPGLMKINHVPTVAEGEMYEDGKKTEALSQIVSHEVSMDFGRFPQKWRSYINGLKLEGGVQSDEGSCTPKPFAMGFEIEYIEDGKSYKELTWFIHCQAKQMEKSAEQRKKDITFGNDALVVTAFKDKEFGDRAYISIDTGNTDVTEKMVEDFFTQVQTSHTITAKP